jgi:hypothetical protein
MRISSARRWAIPVVAGAAFVGAGPLVGVLTSSAQADLPPRTAQQLLVDVQQTELVGFSGTVAESASLGLPALPTSLAPSDADPLALLTGSHTLRVWADGPEHSKIALLSQYGESDLVHDGTDLWAWTSSRHEATHWTLPADSAQQPQPPGQQTPLTPQQLADQVVAALDPTTEVTGDGTTTVAGRSAYVLKLEPRSTTTLVGAVEIDIDGETHVPIRVAVYAAGQSKPALSVGFTHFDPTPPPASALAFEPGPGVSVKQGATEHGSTAHGSGEVPQAERPTVVGTGWDSVLVTALPTSVRTELYVSDEGSGLLQTLPRVSGSWGSGVLLRGTLISAVLTDDGRLALGAVPPETLYSALR